MAIVLLSVAIGVVYDWLGSILLIGLLLFIIVILFFGNLLLRHSIFCSLRKAILAVVASMPEFLVIGI